MFTGIVTDLGTVRSVRRAGDTQLEIATGFDMATIPVGASIACSGVCLTVTERGGDWFAVSASAETLACTTIGDWRDGTRVNLERSLRIGDELGGHLVFGHVDGVGRIQDIRPDGDSRRFTFAAEPEVMRYVAVKGSIAVDGVSLTVNEVADHGFGVNLIPHTLAVTAFGRAQVGDRVNLEIDMIARYVARLLSRD
ncbi:MAG: riboflavin synthase [Rhodospirillales bacterium]|nr:MAG: riboflavin synthase [Rhodospirillales bacterium]